MLKGILKPTFPKIALLSVLLCGVCLFQFKSPQLKKGKVSLIRKTEKKQPVLAPPEENKTALAIIPQTSAPTIEKRTEEKTLPKIVKRKIVTIKKATKKPVEKQAPIPPIPDEAFEIGSGDALDFDAPLDALARTGLEEQGESFNFHANILLSSIQVDEALLPNIPPLEGRLLVQEGEFEENHFEELKNTLTDLEQEKVTVAYAPPRTTALMAQNTVSSQEQGTSSIAVSTDRHETDTVILGEKPEVPDAPEQQQNEPPSTNTVEEEPAVVQRRKVSPSTEETVNTQNSPTLPSLKPMTASVVSGSVSSHPQTGLQVTRVEDPSKNILSKPSTQNTQKKERNLFTAKQGGDEDRDPGIFLGRLVFDSWVSNWLTVNKGHIELSLHPEESLNPQDTQIIHYDVSEEEFEFDSEGMQGRYSLVASLYTPKETLPVAQVKYHKPIYTANYREHILFEINQRNFEKSLRTQATRPLVLTLTVFKGAPGNYRKASPISNASIKVIGHPERGVLRSDAEGGARIQNIPSRSEFIIEVSAEGFYPTRQVVPVFNTNAYSAVYLLAKDEVESVTKFFTKHEQKASKSLLMGRVYNPVTRAPLKNEELTLSFRRGRAVYFNALPDLSLKATTPTGLFGFYNIEPSFRAVERTGKHAALLPFLPGFGYFLELGRGGAKRINGRVMDPFLNQGVDARINLIGDENAAVETQENGTFAFPEIDLPPGIVTLEIHAEKYPTIWQTVPWSAREPERVRNLFMMDNEMLEESLKINRVNQDRSRGMIVGGAEPTFFEQGSKCVNVQLLDTHGNTLSKEAGPYPIAGAKNAHKGFCLTKEAPGFAFFNVPSGEYILKWINEKSIPLRTHILHVGVNRTSIQVN